MHFEDDDNTMICFIYNQTVDSKLYLLYPLLKDRDLEVKQQEVKRP